MDNTDQAAEEQLAEALESIDRYYQQRGIFQDRFGFGQRPAVLVVDFAYGWTDDSYAGGSARLDQPVENTAKLIQSAREQQVPVVYTTSPWRPKSGDQPFKSAADHSPEYREWDQRACQIDDRVAPQTEDYLLEEGERQRLLRHTPGRLSHPAWCRYRADYRVFHQRLHPGYRHRCQKLPLPPDDCA